MRKHFSSLRSQMTLLTTGTVLAVVILATVFYSSAQRMSEKKAATFVHSMGVSKLLRLDLEQVDATLIS